MNANHAAEASRGSPRSGRFEPRAGLLWSEGSGSRYLTDVETGDVYEFNEVAHHIFELARQGEPFDAIVESLMRAYPDASCDELRRDARGILAQMVSERILRPLG